MRKAPDGLMLEKHGLVGETLAGGPALRWRGNSALAEATRLAVIVGCHRIGRASPRARPQIREGATAYRLSFFLMQRRALGHRGIDPIRVNPIRYNPIRCRVSCSYPPEPCCVFFTRFFCNLKKGSPVEFALAPVPRLQREMPASEVLDVCI